MICVAGAYIVFILFVILYVAFMWLSLICVIVVDMIQKMM